MKIKQMVRISLFTTLICVFTIFIPPIIIPIINIPITLQTLIIMIAASVLTPFEAFLSVILYLILGVMGLPVFSGFQSGFVALLKPTGGFLLSFPFAAYLISTFKGKGSFINLFLANFVFGILFIYLVGTIGIYLFYGKKTSYFTILGTMSIVFLVDIGKAIVAAYLGKQLMSISKKSNIF